MATTAAATPARVASPRFSGRLDIWPTVAAFVFLIGGWELLGRALQQEFFPPLSKVLTKLVEVQAEIFAALAISLQNLVIAFAFSLVFGIGLGLLMGAFRKVDAALDVYVNALLTAPSLVFAPVFFAIWGLERWSVIAVIVMYCVWIMVVNTVTAVRTVSIELLEMGESFGAPRLKIWTRIVLPSATPLIMAGVRLAMGRAVKGMLNGEMFIAIVGLGKLVQDGSRAFDASLVLAVLVVIIVIAFICVWLVQLIDNRLTRWLPKTSR
ncbi:MAG: ABC transporter permease subunit [Myxococcales bacterium]|nr:ABC transporter permease subunit [Myxococcales bacterium]